jgi:signal transduction histidine kinase
MNERAVANIPLHEAILSAVDSPMLLVDDTNCVMLINSAARVCFARNLASAKGVHIEMLDHAGEIEAWLTKDGTHAEWSPEVGMIYLPQVSSHFDEVRGGYRIIFLRDLSELRQLGRNQNQFVRIVSHDLRSPLTSILGFAAMLEQGAAGELNERQKQFAGKVLAGIEQLTRLVENIQDAGRFDPETGFYEMERTPCDVGELVERVASQLVIPAEKPNLRLTVAIDETIPIIHADSNMLEKAVLNLIDNAMKYTPDGGLVAVSARRDGERVIITVHDDGLGISPEDQERLFQRHVRIPRQEFKKIKGSGLGLFIVRSVAQRHDGQAWVESELNHGSKFFIALPLRKSG